MGYDNTNKGTLFRNDRKESNNHPDYRGTLNVGGEEFWISGWIKTAGELARNPGQKYMSLAVTKKGISSDMSGPSNFDNDDEIPF